MDNLIESRGHQMILDTRQSDQDTRPSNVLHNEYQTIFVFEDVSHQTIYLSKLVEQP